MKGIPCRRCRATEDIPTHQFVKFDEKVQYLCKKCYEGFRRWFNTGSRLASTPSESTI